MKKHAKWRLFPFVILFLAALVFFPVTRAKLSGTHSPRTFDPGKKETAPSKGRPSKRKEADADAARRVKAAKSPQDPIEEDEGDDPDIPPFQKGKIDKAELLRLREEQIAMIRGIQPDQPFDPEARGRAIEMMEQQQGEQ